MKPVILYEVNFQPWDASWLLSGPVGANGFLLFQSARDAVSHARWSAKANGGTITVFEEKGKLFTTIEISQIFSVKMVLCSLRVKLNLLRMKIHRRQQLHENAQGYFPRHFPQ